MQWAAGSQYRISYRSESGTITDRTIDLIRTSSSYGGTVYLRAFCRLRAEERTFREDRILSCQQVGAMVLERPRLSPVMSATMEVRTVPFVATRMPELARSHINAPTRPVRLEREPFDIGTFLGKAVWTVIGGAMAVCLVGALSQAAGSFSRSSAHITPLFSSIPAPKSRAVPAPMPQPKPAVEDTTIAGVTLRTLRDGEVESYEVPSLGLRTSSKLEAIAAIRLPPFIATTGITDQSLIDHFLGADLNHSGRLSYDELSTFQIKTYKEFRYESNDVALRPDEFLAAGGGDCDDFALYTAGLLRFWGWEPYLGCLSPGDGKEGHAICLSHEEEPFSKAYAYYDVSATTTEDGSSLRPGRYVPIDYDLVGGLTDAAGKGWRLTSIYVPEKAWGRRM